MRSKVLCFAVLAILGLLRPPFAFAVNDSVRVTAQNASVRLKADPRSIVIISVGAGTVLDVIAVQGDWFEVALPPAANGLKRTGFISRTVVELVGSPKPVQPGRHKPDSSGLAAGLTWTDPSTHLMWALQDNGSNLTWDAANRYCSGLTLGVYTGWRLPSIKELAWIYDPAVNLAGTYNGKEIIWHIKGGIHLSGGPWSATKTSGAMGPSAWLFDFYSGQRCGMYTIYSGGGSFDDPRALCVRPAVESGQPVKEIQQQRFIGKPCTAD